VDCGGEAKDWAYLHTGEQLVSPSGQTYSENFDDYAPMCRSCHRRFDMARNPIWRNKLANHIRGAAEDPEAFEAERKRRTHLAALRRTCSCGLVSNPGAVAYHAKVQGHTVVAS
jgi:hypothetical protein